MEGQRTGRVRHAESQTFAGRSLFIINKNWIGEKLLVKVMHCTSTGYPNVSEYIVLFTSQD